MVTEMALVKRYDDDGNVIDQHDDSLSRESVVAGLKKIDKILCDSNAVMYGIDIVTEDSKVLYEIEYGKSWSGNRWTNPKTQDKFNVGYFTTNIPDRKFYIWGILAKYVATRDKDILKYSGIEVHYVRINADHNQIVIIRDWVIRNPNKRRLIENQLVYPSDRLEDWWVIRREDCETYNKQLNGDWVLDTLPVGKYDPRTTRGAEMFRNLKNNK